MASWRPKVSHRARGRFTAREPQVRSCRRRPGTMWSRRPNCSPVITRTAASRRAFASHQRTATCTASTRPKGRSPASRRESISWSSDVARSRFTAFSDRSDRLWPPPLGGWGTPHAGCWVCVRRRGLAAYVPHPHPVRESGPAAGHIQRSAAGRKGLPGKGITAVLGGPPGARHERVPPSPATYPRDP